MICPDCNNKIHNDFCEDCNKEISPCEFFTIEPKKLNSIKPFKKKKPTRTFFINYVADSRKRLIMRHAKDNRHKEAKMTKIYEGKPLAEWFWPEEITVRHNEKRHR